MNKIKTFKRIIDKKRNIYHTQYLYNCPGCGYEHAFSLKSEGGAHTFNMNLENPTISPSLLNNFTPDRICHSFIKNGTIQFLNDCWHELRGKTVELPRYLIKQ